MPLYERLIDEGLADADARGGAVDHVTARRLAIWLATRPQHREFAHGLLQFAKTGGITQALKAQLRSRARTVSYPHQPQAARLMQYTVARGRSLGPIGPDFGAACDQIDRADAMLTGLRDRVRHGSLPEPAWPDAPGPRIVALARHDHETRTVSLILDAATANIAIFAITAHAADREAHVREVEQYGQRLPEGSYGRHDREAIAARETRITTRLRAIERAYHSAIEYDAAPTPEPLRGIPSARQAADYEMELE